VLNRAKETLSRRVMEDIWRMPGTKLMTNTWPRRRCFLAKRHTNCCCNCFVYIPCRQKGHVPAPSQSRSLSARCWPMTSTSHALIDYVTQRINNCCYTALGMHRF